MTSILRWSLENSAPLDNAASDRPSAERKDLDPAIIDYILGKPDSVQMKEDLAVAVDPSKSEDERISALDHLEMLIENIDNSNDLETLKIWEPLHSLLTAESSTPEIITQTLWVIGTALQNNPSAQDAYLSYNPVRVILSFIDPSTASSASIRSKAIYSLSGLLKHNRPAVEALGTPEADGWSKLRTALQDPVISIRRKAVFLLSTLLIPELPPTTTASAPQTTLENSMSTLSLTTTTTDENPANPSIHLHDQRPAPTPGSGAIHPNSHAAYQHNPSRSDTSGLTLAALSDHNILDAIISGLTSPLPYGEDGENTEADDDFEEKAIR
ncbi:hypothetical protein M413DRAFT_18747 [Hebeloma cylindrosporum]|uniref:Nucleotide exchange factor Fes1 domain-containing protein n=1 Tax=Hebeloma cylindrosporum TaxID=76867 RepID=A0A0C3BYY8_HEBCY|nr:hypothetical protein M413DRAFT_18747 [Hebeloma cylindrosporum h7]